MKQNINIMLNLLQHGIYYLNLLILNRKTPTDKEVDESTATSTTTTSDEDLDSPGSKKSTDIEGIAKCSDDVTNFASILLLKENYCIDCQI